MKLSGSYQINLGKQKVWEALNDPEILQKTIPGCEDFKKNSETEFTATATNKIGPFNASFTGDIELKDLDPPNSYKITGSGNSPVGFANGEASVVLEDFEGGTKLTYTVEANVVVTPGNGYGDAGEGYIRLSLTIPDDQIDEGLKRISKIRVSS